MRILVTGAQGFLGRATVARLAESGFEVHALVRRAGTTIAGARATIIGDMTDPGSIERATAGMDAVVHLAALKSDEARSYAVNVEGMRSLIAVCKKTSVRHIVYVSSASAKIAIPGVYGSTKKEAEQLVMESGIPATIVRPSLVYGDLTQGAFGALVKAARLPLIPMFGDGKWISHPIHVDDVARAIEIILTNRAMQGRAYDVGGKEPISLNALMDKICRDLLRQSRARIVHLPPRTGIMLARTLRLFMDRPPITESNVLGSTQNIEWDGEIFFTDAGFVPRSLAAGFADIIREERKNEARVLYRYIYSRSGFSHSPSPAIQERYRKACLADDLPPPHPLLMRMPALIGPLDAASRLFAQESPLQYRLLIASALVEADTASAPWLLPRARTKAALVADALYLSLSASTKIIIGCLLALVPGFLKKYAG